MGLGRETLPQEQTNITGTKHFCAVGVGGIQQNVKAQAEATATSFAAVLDISGVTCTTTED